MPTYEYRCSDCKNEFQVILTIREHSSYQSKCPKCDSKKVEQLLSTFFAETSKKS